MLIHHSLLALHLLAAAFWVGGMATLQSAVRPAIAANLPQPPQRLALMAGVLQRFFFGVTLAIVALLCSGLAMVLLSGGFRAQPPSVHAMLLLGLLMMALFGHIRLGLYTRLQRAIEAAAWPTAGVALNGIRRLVGVNLVLGVVVFVVALLGRVP